MLLDIGSLMFNMSISNGGGTPSWGTAMGQGADGHKFHFDDMDTFIPGLLYNSVSDIRNVTDVTCPLGKGGNRQEDFEYVLASLFNKVYVNETKLQDTQFLLLIVKQIAGNNHIERRTLKYSPRIQYDGKEIDKTAYEHIKAMLGLNDESAWFIRSMSIVNQDELHLEVYVASESEKNYTSVEERKNDVNRIVGGFTLCNYNSANDALKRHQFGIWLTKKGKAQPVVKNYPIYIGAYVSSFIGKDVYQITDENELKTTYEKTKADPNDSRNNNVYSSAVKNYIEFVEEITSGISLNNQTGPNETNPGLNLVIYGTPGCGKSYYVDNVLLKSMGLNPDTKGNVFRTTFYPDYSNVDFIGQIIPQTDGTNVSYSMMPGPFTLALEKAYSNLGKNNDPVVLIIEELNRGNAAAIFGDIFQLLDRDENGNSRYHIKNQYIQDYLNKQFEDDGLVFNDIYIPHNLYIVATMNTSDQNVFKLDNAFKRRWNFEKMKNTFDAGHPYRDYLVPGLKSNSKAVPWEILVKAINDYMLDLNDDGDLLAEDKQMGVYFVDKDTLIDPAKTPTNDESTKKEKKFEAKVLEYIWDDVAKFEPSQWFDSKIRSFDDLIDEYEKKGIDVFSPGFKDEISAKLSEMASSANSENANSSGNANEQNGTGQQGQN